jgi:hypothetical protein
MSILSRFKWILGLVIVGMTAVFIFNPAAAQQGERALGEARQQVEENGAYSFTADIEQTLIPRPVVSMIGESSQRVDMRLDGDVSQPDLASLQLRFEGDGANAQPLVFQQEGSDTYLLKDGERIKIDSPTAGALPTTDMMTYLAAAENITLLDSVNEPVELTRYGFDISGTRLIQVFGAQNGSTNSQTELSLSPTLRNTTGSGEVWIDEDGFPRRQIIDLNIPEITDEYNTAVHIIVDYRYGNGAAVEMLPGYAAFQSVEDTAVVPNQQAVSSTAIDQSTQSTQSTQLPNYQSVF